MYHAITDGLVADDDFQMSTPASLFEEHMATLRRWGLDVLPLDEGVRRANAGDLRTPAVAITFDDGYVGLHDHAAEILARHDIPSTLFLTTGAIGRGAFEGISPALGRPLSWDEVATMRHDTRCAVGSHTVSHPVLATANDNDVRAELEQSRDTIAARLGEAPRLFAYPFGSYNSFSPRTRQALVDAGFQAACTTVWGTNREGDDAMAIRRVRVSWCDSARELMKSLAGCYDWFRFVQRWQAGSAR